MKQKISLNPMSVMIMLIVGLVFGILSVGVFSSTASAIVCGDGYTQEEGKCVPAAGGGAGAGAPSGSTGPSDSSSSEGDMPQTPDPAVTDAVAGCGTDTNCGKIYGYLLGATNLLSALVGVACVAMIIFGGIEFSTSGGDPNKVASGKKHITNAVIALIAFFFLWAFLNFLIPGGLLSSSGSGTSSNAPGNSPGSSSGKKGGFGGGGSF